MTGIEVVDWTVSMPQFKACLDGGLYILTRILDSLV